MCNAASKTLLAAVALAMAATACTSEKERRAAAAEQLRVQAEALVASGQSEQALALLDSLDNAYGEQTAVRRNALATRAAAIEAATMERIGPAQEALVRAQLTVDSLQALFVHIEGTRGLEGHRVAKELAKNNVTASTGIEPRIDGDGHMSIAAVVKGKRIGLNSLSVTTAAGTVQTAPVSGERCIVSEGTELTSLRQEEVAEAMEAIAAAGDGPVKLHLDGSRGSVEVKLTPALRAALVRSWQYAQALQQLRSASIERERLERTLQTARDHRANAPLPSSAEE